jgi:hypothetical protein
MIIENQDEQEVAALAQQAIVEKYPDAEKRAELVFVRPLCALVTAVAARFSEAGEPIRFPCPVDFGKRTSHGSLRPPERATKISLYPMTPASYEKLLEGIESLLMDEDGFGAHTQYRFHEDRLMFVRVNH